jgi:D-arabinose 1-dehydrogenase-like Zn-dependent alcohol dehydrogenase
MLIVADAAVAVDTKGFSALFKKYGQPASVTLFGLKSVQTDVPVTAAASIADLPDNAFDDILYFGADPAALEAVFKKIANAGLLVIAQGGKTFGRPVETPIGRIHYGNIRIIGTSGHNPAEALDKIPVGGEIRKDDKINVIGAGGPMGVMHVVRNLCQGVPGVTVYGGDLDDNRLEALSKIARPLAQKNRVGYTPYNPAKNPPAQAFDYIVLMAPVAKLVAQAVLDAAPAGRINIFAGIPASVFGPIDIDTYCRNNIYFIGTSGSTLDDMLAVLAKVQSGALDTNISVAAVCGLHGAIEASGPLSTTPSPARLSSIPTAPAADAAGKLKPANPDAAAKLADGLWTKQAEQTLIKA